MVSVTHLTKGHTGPILYEDTAGGAMKYLKLLLICSLIANVILSLTVIDRVFKREVIKFAALAVIPVIYPFNALARYNAYQGIDPYLDYLEGKKVNVLDYTEEDRKHRDEILENKLFKKTAFTLNVIG